MKEPKTAKAPKQMYEQNIKTSRALRISAPIIKWGLLGLAIIFIALMLTNSLGNLSEITNLLDANKYNGEELAENYAYLTDKYGEWILFGRDGGAPISVRFVDFRAAFFSGVAITFLILTIISLVLSVVLGKILFPSLSKSLKEQAEYVKNLDDFDANEIIKKLEKPKKVKEDGRF